MYNSHNVNTAKMTGGSKHEEIKDWEKRVDDFLGDGTVHETPDMLVSHTDGATWEDELRVGHAVMSGEHDATWAYNELGK